MGAIPSCTLTRRALMRAAAAGCIGWPAGGRAQRPAAAGGAGLLRRSALVIGNGAYRSAPLKNPVGDARAMAAALKDLGYDVTLRLDTTLKDLLLALGDFTLGAAASGVRVLFYAGHGVQAKGRNYLLPIDAEPQSEDEVPTQAADVNQVVDRLSAYKQGLNVVVLDACRVNPFAGGVIVAPDGRRLKFRGAAAGGLARLDAPVGTLVAYSTAPNGVALDGKDSAHSVYAKHLLSHIRTPGLPIEKLFKLVRMGVAEETQRFQVPWESSSLITDFCFRPAPNGQCS